MRSLTTCLLFAIAATAMGCGYSEEEWQAQLDKYNRLVSEHQQTEAKLAETNEKLEKAMSRVDKLEQDLKAAGVDLKKLSQSLESRQSEISKLSSTLEERERALAEYKARAEQLERIKSRFEKLRRKLDELTSLGLEVKIRHNRMIISLPGDVLFPSGSDRLKPGAEDILDQVAEIITNDQSLKSRYYQVAGHTDNQPYGAGRFRDNWGLSLMRARRVLLYLIDPERGLPKDRWSASGYADTDPIATNETKDGRQKNRRVELVVVPSAEEMLDLKEIAS